MTDWVGVAGIGGTLGGVILGKWTERRSADRSWLRDRRLQAVSEILAACYEFDRSVVSYIRNGEFDGENYEALGELMAPAQLAHARLEVLGPAALVAAGEDLVRHLLVVLESVSTLERSMELRRHAGTSQGREKWPEGAEYNRLLNELTAIARTTVGRD